MAARWGQQGRPSRPRQKGSGFNGSPTSSAGEISAWRSTKTPTVDPPRRGHKSQRTSNGSRSVPFLPLKNQRPDPVRHSTSTPNPKARPRFLVSRVYQKPAGQPHRSREKRGLLAEIPKHEVRPRSHVGKSLERARLRSAPLRHGGSRTGMGTHPAEIPGRSAHDHGYGRSFGPGISEFHRRADHRACRGSQLGETQNEA